jgi:beta-glucanase (GH16 family)
MGVFLFLGISYIDGHTVKTNLCLLALLAVFLALLPLPAGAQSETERHGWQLTFDDEFNGPTLDTRKWTCDVGTSPTREEPLQYFLPSSVRVDQGHLRITSKHQWSHGRTFTSGEIQTQDKFCQLYGRVETRCRFPKTPGAWSAVYLLPADGSWPPEIDVAEFIGRDPTEVWLTNHWKNEAGQHQQANRNYVDPTVNWGLWHTYAMEWQPYSVRWYIDGILRGEAVGPVSATPMYLRINTAVGGVFAHGPASGPWPQVFEVDYVRMYRHSGDPAPIFGPVPRLAPPPSYSFPPPTYSFPPPP